MIETSMDILILSGALGIVVLTIFIAVLGVKTARVLGHLEHIIDRADRLTEKVERFILMPIEFIENHFGDFSFIKNIISKLIK